MWEQHEGSDGTRCESARGAASARRRGALFSKLLSLCCPNLFVRSNFCVVSALVGHWARIASELPHRTGSQCLSKWKMLVRVRPRPPGASATAGRMRGGRLAGEDGGLWFPAVASLLPGGRGQRELGLRPQSSGRALPPSTPSPLGPLEAHLLEASPQRPGPPAHCPPSLSPGGLGPLSSPPPTEAAAAQAGAAAPSQGAVELQQRGQQHRQQWGQRGLRARGSAGGPDGWPGAAANTACGA